MDFANNNKILELLLEADKLYISDPFLTTRKSIMKLGIHVPYMESTPAAAVNRSLIEGLKQNGTPGVEELARFVGVIDISSISEL